MDARRLCSLALGYPTRSTTERVGGLRNLSSSMFLEHRNLSPSLLLEHEKLVARIVSSENPATPYCDFGNPCNAGFGLRRSLVSARQRPWRQRPGGRGWEAEAIRVSANWANLVRSRSLPQDCGASTPEDTPHLEVWRDSLAMKLLGKDWQMV